MNNTKEYTNLKKRIKQLEKNYNFKENFNGPTLKQRDLLKSFILLCHAEFEEYFEGIALRILIASEQKWKKQKVANYNLVSLLLKSDKFSKGDSTTNICNIISTHRNFITNKNHGIKAKNLLNMYEPLGYIESDFEMSFLSDLNTLGSFRGDVAHHSDKKVTILKNKDDIYSLVNLILTQIPNFEEVLREKCSRF